MQELDGYTIRQEPVSSINLMERAALAVTCEICNRWDNSTPIVVFAGPGNNGGDALAVARLLSQRGYQTEAFLFNINGKLSEDCQKNKERLESCPSVKFQEITSQFEPPQLTAGKIVIDGLFGTGQNKALNGGFASLVKFINASPADVVSIDMPSGLMCEDNTYNVRGHIVRSRLTLTFQLPKLALLLADNQPFVGELKILDIGLSQEGISHMDTPFCLTEENEVRLMLRKRNPFGHKGTFGHVLLIAGRYGMAGAAILAAKACLKSGVGKVTVHTPVRNNDILQISIPEAILSHDQNQEIFTSPVSSEKFNALAIGPGLGTEHSSAIAFIEQVRHAHIPVLIDADGINILSEHKGWIQQIPQDCILTPHPAEMQRLGNRSIDSYSTLAEAIEMATRHKFHIILKGHYTAVCTPEGKVYFNPTGNSGMATAGSGDVLTGIIVSLLAGKYPAENACRLGVYLHGLAGDIAARKLGEESVTASDIIEALPAAFLHLREQ